MCGVRSFVCRSAEGEATNQPTNGIEGYVPRYFKSFIPLFACCLFACCRPRFELNIIKASAAAPTKHEDNKDSDCTVVIGFYGKNNAMVCFETTQMRAGGCG